MNARPPEGVPDVATWPPERPGAAVSNAAPAPAAPSGDARAAVRLERACAELRHGRPIGLRAGSADGNADPAGPVLLLQALETLDAQAFAASTSWPGGCHLVLTAERHAALGEAAHEETDWLSLPAGTTLKQAQAIAGLAGPGGVALADDAAAVGAWVPGPVPARSLVAALQLAKWARLTPALLVGRLPDGQAEAWLAEHDTLAVHAGDVALREREALPLLRRVSDGRIPVGEDGESCTLVLFREPERDAEHVAVVYGEPDPAQPVPVRLHSSCLTGDLLGSLRCDCGEQLLRAAAQLQRSGGVLLYLAQEGRGTGLASKLRAYRLQDTGLDTLDADRYLGFRGDERDFRPAAAMLVALGIRRVALMTNNPAKIGALTRGGIEVVERLPLVAEPNPHNARYLSTKRERAGHLAHDAQIG